MAPSLSEHFLFLRLLLLSLLLPSLTLSQNSSSSSSSPSTSCPLDFSVLAKPLNQSAASNSIPSDTSHRCDFARNCLHLVLSQYLLTSSRFLPPPSAAASCWSALADQLAPFLPPPFSLLSSCGFQTPAISQGCMNISTLQAFDAAVPAAARAAVNQSCNQPLLPIPACTACSASLNQLAAGYLRGGSPNASGAATCADYAAIYAGAFANRFGLADNGTVFCLFLLGSNSTFPPPSSTAGANGGGGGGPAAWVYGVAAAAAAGSLLLLLAALAVWLRKRRHRRRRRKSVGSGSRPNAAMESLNASTNLIKFTFEEIKAATKGFSRENLIGRGGYGNVYRGTLPGGDEVAVKRFKNCSAAGDASFVHEVEVIASVRHVNLVDLRGYCSATTQMEGYQRMIVCDLMRKGSLHDHLFGSSPEEEEEEEGGRRRRRLSWPLRQRIAVGTARGLAYLHDGARPAIIHRDIKASNILLDERFEPKVADFGLARFAPEGASHVSTRVAGTLGYVAPEYALYGQLTEKSDVYSFGVVLLELLSGRKALVSMGEGQAFLVTDWAWSLVRKGRALAVIEEGMEEPGPEHVMEKYVHVAVLCTHPQLHARPTMDQIVKILETDMAVPSIPDRPIPIVSSMEDISRSVSSSGSGQLSSFAGYQSFSFGPEAHDDE